MKGKTKDNCRTALQKHRARKAEEGCRYLQVAADPETLRLLKDLRKRMCKKRKTADIIKNALKSLHDKFFVNP